MQYLHTMVRVADLEQSLKFYRDALGMVEVSRHDYQGGRFTLCFLAAPEDQDRAHQEKAPMLELTHNWEPQEYNGGRNFGHLAFRVDNIYETCQRLIEHGVTINRPRVMAAWRLCARRITFLLSCCKQAVALSRPRHGGRCKILGSGRAVFRLGYAALTIANSIKQAGSRTLKLKRN